MKKRKYTFILLSISLIFALSTFFVLLTRIRIESRYINIAFVHSDDIKLYGSDITIDKGSNYDNVKINLSYGFHSELNENSFITFTVPKYSKIQRACENFSCSIEPVYLKSFLDNHKRISFEIENKKHLHPRSFDLEIASEIVSTSARELELKLSISPVSSKTFPINLSINGLDKTDITYINPSPPQTYLYSIVYQPLSWNNESAIIHPKPITIQMKDREISYSYDFWNFFIGIFLGFLSSLIASILWDLLKDIEHV